MLAKCMEFLGHHCKLEKEIPYTRAANRLASRGKGKGQGAIPKLDNLFRRGPPWVYPPLSSGTVLVATRRSAGARAIEAYHRLTEDKFPLSSVISFHRVRPSHRTPQWDKDPRCRVIAEYMKLESGPAHWSSRCLPTFVLLGTPKSGTTSLFNWILQHPDLRAPVRKELHFWAPVLTPEKNCADREDCNVFKNGKSNAKEGGTRSTTSSTAHWPLSTVSSGRMLSNYIELFPRVDPREFGITGEASPAYIYSPSVALFMESPLGAHTKLILLLRDPTERAFSEFKNKRDLMLKGAPKASVWVSGYAHFSQLVRFLKISAVGCSPEELYRACRSCTRFISAPGAVGAEASNIDGNANYVSNSVDWNASYVSERCEVPPVIWQSWYHIFIPRYQRRSRRLLIEFSDDLFDAPQTMMQRVGAYIGLPQYAYSTDIAYNTEKKRGAYIAQTGNQSTQRVGNMADASQASASRSKASASDKAVVDGLMRHSVARLQGILHRPDWEVPPQQYRRALPPKWIERYQVGLTK